MFCLCFPCRVYETLKNATLDDAIAAHTAENRTFEVQVSASSKGFK